jgi:2-oxoglutarate dehydrogenase E2 component (dihydrolipoamide succinyltransferase)
MHNVLIPALGESITEGVISKWLVADGATVAESTPVLELETDKITTEIQAGAAGILRRKAAEGSPIKVGAVAAVIEPGAAGAAPAAAPVAAAPAAAPAAKGAAQPGPAAQKLLAETGVDPAKIQGTGKDGRVTKGDVLAATAAKPSAPAPSAAPATPPLETRNPKPETRGGVSRRRMTPIRQRIAQRLVQAQRTAAILTTFNEVDMSAAMALRKKWKEPFEKQHGTGLGFMSIFATAVVHALRKYPLVNSQIDGTDIVTPDGVHLSIAIGTEKGLVVPVLRDAQDMGFADIEKAIKGYAGKAKEGKLTLDDMNGGTFTITNGGVYGSLMSTPILNPPQSGILGMHAIKDRPVAVDGQVVIRPMMYIALSYDHRIVDGAEAVGFLVRVKELVEAPERLLLGL